MKKKVKDCTVAEIRRFCERHICDKCPLFKRDLEFKEYRFCLLYIPDRVPNWMLEEEIEIPEESENDNREES